MSNFSFLAKKKLIRVPLPSWKHVLKAFFYYSTIDNDKISKPWVEKDDLGYWLSRSSWSIHLIAKFRMSIFGKKEINVWLPGYFCNESIAPLRELNVNLVFYPISEDGSPDIKTCESLLTKKLKPDLFIAVDYFGRKIDFEETGNFVRSLQGWLIEDAAHILLPKNTVGGHAHFVLFSPHKFLPVPDGAMLVIKRNNFFREKSIDWKAFENQYEMLINKSKELGVTPYYWLMKRCLQKLGFRTNAAKKIKFDEEELVMSTLKFIHPKISGLARKLLFFLLDQLEEEIIIRNKKYLFWKKLLKKENLRGEEIFPKYNHVSPYLFGMKFLDNKTAKETYSFLLEKGIPVSSWPDLPPEVLVNPEQFKESMALRYNSLFFPIHNSLNIHKFNINVD